MKDLLDEIEEKWIHFASKAVVEASKEEPIYAGAFWLLYCDYTQVGVPCFALNPETHESAEDDDTRWVPPEWKTDVHDCVAELQPLYTQLSESMAGKPEKDWNKLMEEQCLLLCRVCKRITKSYHNGEGPFSDVAQRPDFLVAVIEEREGEEWYEWFLKNSIDPMYQSKAKGFPKLA